MPSFAYVARTPAGEEVAGHLSGADIDQAVQHLHAQGLVVLNLRENRSSKSSVSFLSRISGASIGAVRTRDLALFTRQLATMIEAGIPLVRGLKGLSADESNQMLRRSAGDVAERMERGEGLADAMAHHPQCFHQMYVSLVRAGEQSGTLDSILEELAVYLERLDATKTKVRSAMAYPIFVLTFALLVTLFLLFKIVPTFEEIYADMGQQLPAMTQTVIDISNAIRGNMLIASGLVATLLGLFFLWTRTKPGRYALDSALLRMPIFGPILQKAVLSRFARTFGILLQSGLPVLESLELVKGATGNAVISGSIEEVKRRVAAGQAITDSFRATRRMPEMVLQLMGTGEETGDLDGMLLKVSDFYDRQVEAAVHGLSSLIEPLLIVLVGALVGVIVVTMFLPIFYLGDAIMKGGANL